MQKNLSLFLVRRKVSWLSSRLLVLPHRQTAFPLQIKVIRDLYASHLTGYTWYTSHMVIWIGKLYNQDFGTYSTRKKMDIFGIQEESLLRIFLVPVISGRQIGEGYLGLFYRARPSKAKETYQFNYTPRKNLSIWRLACSYPILVTRSILLCIMKDLLMALDIISPSLISTRGANLPISWYIFFLCEQTMLRPVMSIEVSQLSYSITPLGTDLT